MSAATLTLSRMHRDSPCRCGKEGCRPDAMVPSVTALRMTRSPGEDFPTRSPLPSPEYSTSSSPGSPYDLQHLQQQQQQQQRLAESKLFMLLSASKSGPLTSRSPEPSYPSGNCPSVGSPDLWQQQAALRATTTPMRALVGRLQRTQSPYSHEGSPYSPELSMYSREGSVYSREGSPYSSSHSDADFDCKPLDLKSHPSPPPPAVSEQPMDLSCKKRRIMGHSVHRGNGQEDSDAKITNTSSSSEKTIAQSPILKSILCGQVSSRKRPSPFHYSLPPSPVSPSEVTSGRPRSNSSSILSDILNRPRIERLFQDYATRDKSPRHHVMSSNDQQQLAPSSDLHHPATATDSIPHTPADDSHTPVVLAKKNMFPVTARVSDWLVKIVDFAKSRPEFLHLSYTDQVSLLLNSWARILVLYMAEHNFEFAVTPTADSRSPSPQHPVVADPSSDVPTRRSVEDLQRFIRKCQSLQLDQQEFSYLKMITLFSSGYCAVENSTYTDSVNSHVRQALQRHTCVTHPTQKTRYSQLLLVLPSLFTVNCKMVETLFCRHIIGDADMHVLLKEMLQKF